MEAYEIFVNCCDRAFKVVEDENTWKVIRVYSPTSIRVDNYWKDSNGNIFGGNYGTSYKSVEEFFSSNESLRDCLSIMTESPSKAYFDYLSSRLEEMFDKLFHFESLNKIPYNGKSRDIFMEDEFEAIYFKLYGEKISWEDFVN